MRFLIIFLTPVKFWKPGELLEPTKRGTYSRASRLVFEAQGEPHYSCALWTSEEFEKSELYLLVKLYGRLVTTLVLPKVLFHNPSCGQHESCINMHFSGNGIKPIAYDASEFSQYCFCKIKSDCVFRSGKMTSSQLRLSLLYMVNRFSLVVMQ